MEKHEVYSFIKDIQAKITSNQDSLDLIVAYGMVDEAIRDQKFYHQTPYFLSEWIFLKDQIARKDEESLGYLDRFLDNILYDGGTGVYEAYIEKIEK